MPQEAYLLLLRVRTTSSRDCRDLRKIGQQSKMMGVWEVIQAESPRSMIGEHASLEV